MTDGDRIADELKQAGARLTQADVDLIISTLADVNCEQSVRALVHLEGGELSAAQYWEWLKGDAGLLADELPR
ncbi:hypothetical protein [Lacticaseibacillus zhaodongensis]|uniref:hypothetical protein n=1 Tax=Lacticaseibacillus zhaodongensis TaxID=2668065 RepID=UPI0012D2B416|nr:hypothetical protein [Lacticaseibacillus zhaodongensis]